MIQSRSFPVTLRIKGVNGTIVKHAAPTNLILIWEKKKQIQTRETEPDENIADKVVTYFSWTKI